MISGFALYLVILITALWIGSIVHHFLTQKMPWTDRLVCWFGAGTWRGPKGTWGSLMAFPWIIIVHFLAGTTGLFVASLVFYVVGIWICDKYVERTGEKDPSFAVIDEVAGQFLTFSFFTSFHPIGLVIGFFLFRFFDITKIQPARFLESLPKGLGIMSDDMVAGAYAAVCLYFITYYAGFLFTI